ncbi:MAG: leucine-rich repeat domain-containing protein [Candidatus Hodarchaeota archaeon]
MNSEDHGLTCAACGLMLSESEIYTVDKHSLCSRCTLNGTTEPEYESIIYALTIGYFINEQKITQFQVALEKAHEFLSQLPFWQDKMVPIPTLTGLRNVKRVVDLSSNMKALGNVEKQLERSDFFISHKWGGQCDVELVDPLVAALKERGYRVWYDKDMWEKETEKTSEYVTQGIQQARCCVPVFRQAYFNNRNCLLELKSILKKRRKLKHVFPIWWKDLTPEFLEEHKLGWIALEIPTIMWSEVADIETLAQELIKQVNAAEGLQDYNGIPLVAAEARILKNLEAAVQEPIPPLDSKDMKSTEQIHSSPSFGFSSKSYHVNRLFLVAKGLKALPKEFGILSNLQELDLSNNQIGFLPESFGKLKNLDSLNLTGNLFSSLPPSFSNLKKLLTKKYPQVVDSEAIVLFSLELLVSKPIPFVSTINHSTFGFTVKDGHVTALNLRSQGLRSLPEGFGHLTGLETLWLSNNKLYSLPNSLGTLAVLKRLELGFNQLQALPDSFGQLTQLTKLDLESNRLVSLPDSFGQLQNLQRVELQNNDLVSLPESFGQLDQLLELKLFNNHLRSLPESFGELKDLKELNLGKNQLEKLPKSFSQLSNLWWLYLDNNPISSLPESFGDLKNLISLDLTGDPLYSLPETFSNLKELKNLNLSDTPLAGLRAERKKLERIIPNCTIQWK